MRRLPVSLGLLSAALIGFQLVLMQLLSIAQWHHFAYMVISVALLGFGASGTVIALTRSWFLKWFDLLVPSLMFASGLAMPAAAALSQSDAARFDSYVLLIDAAQYGSLLLTYLLLFVPFFLGALAVGLILIRYAKVAGSFYFANLLGSGVGAIAALGLMWIIEPTLLPVVMGLLSVAAGLVVVTRRYRLWLMPGGLLALLLCVPFAAWPPQIDRSQYKDISRTLDLPNAEIEHEESSPYGLVQVVSAPAIRYAPGLSLTYTGDIPVEKAVFNNGNWFGAVSSWNDSTSLLDYTTAALPYAVRRPQRVAVLSAGTLTSAAQALANGAGQVNAVEPHESVVSLLRHELADETDSLLYHPDLRVHGVEPRTYLAASDSRFDLITLPIIGSFGGTVGLFALQEEYTLTVEAFREMWRRLGQGGSIALTVWMDYPYRSPLKAVATVARALRDEGVDDPTDHFAALRSWGTMTLMASRAPLDSLDTQRIRRFAREMSFDPVLLPNLRAGERMQYNVLQDTTFFESVDRALAGDERFFDEYAFDVAPATDNSPYFSQFLRWGAISGLAEEFGEATFPFIELGTLIAGATFIQIVAAALLLIILPLRTLGWRGGGKLWTLVYFAGLGVGFMFMEIVLIQRFTLYLGHPIYATAAVLGGILIFSGMGSRISEIFQVRGRLLAGVAALVCIFVLGYTFVLAPLMRGTIGAPLFWKAVITLPIVGIPALLMGMPFPMGLRYLSRRRGDHLPWAWAINNCFSVMSSALAALLAVQIGFIAVMLVAAGSYGVAAIITLFRT